LNRLGVAMLGAITGGAAAVARSRGMANGVTQLRYLLANIITDAGSMREIVANVMSDTADRAYVDSEVDRLQAEAHRIIAFSDEHAEPNQRNRVRSSAK